jgi:hypothetical protein
MDVSRSQLFFVGLVLLFLGLQFRVIDTITLTPEFTRYLAERTNHPAVATANTVDALVGTKTPIPPKTFPPPDWLGWSLVSIGSVLILHALAMPRPK